MENQNQQLTVKQQTQLEEIAKAGNLTELSFAKKTIEFIKIKDLEVMEVRKLLGLIFVKVANLSGIKEPISDINKQDIRDMILTKYRNLSIQEIDYAFKLDRYSGTPENHYQLFNAEYVAKVLKKYQDWLLKTRQTNNLSISTTKTEPVPTPEEIEKILLTGLENTFNIYKETGSIGIIITHLYDYLDEKGFMPTDVNVKNAVLKLAKERVQLKSELCVNKIEKALYKIIENGKPSSMVIVECKKISLLRFFDEFTTFEQMMKRVDKINLNK